MGAAGPLGGEPHGVHDGQQHERRLAHEGERGGDRLAQEVEGVRGQPRGGADGERRVEGERQSTTVLPRSRRQASPVTRTDIRPIVPACTRPR